MNTKDTGLNDDDAQFDEFLQGKGELSELLRALPQEQPSAALDAEILADARRSLQSGLIKALPGNPVMQLADVGPAANQANEGAAILPIRSVQARPVGFLTRWRVPLGICATLVLSLSVTLNVWQEQSQSVTQAPREVSNEVPKVASKDVSKEVRREAQQPIIVEVLKMPTEPAVTPEMPMVVMAESAAERAVASTEKDKSQRLAKAKSNALMAEKSAQKEDIREAKREAEAEAIVRSRQLADVKTEPLAKPTAPVVQTEPTQIAAASPPPPAPQKPTVRRSVAAAPPMEMAAAPPMEMAATTTLPAAAKKSELAGASSVTSPPLDAKTWLSQIEKLILDDKRQEALEAWQKFRQVYPDYVVEKNIEKQIEVFRSQK